MKCACRSRYSEVFCHFIVDVCKREGDEDLKSVVKKMPPFVSPFVFGLFGGLLVECVVDIFSMVMSPFAELEKMPFLVFLCIISVLSAIVLIVMVIVNIRYLTDLNKEYKIRIAVIAETLIGIFLFFLSWKLWNSVVGELYYRF